MPSSLDIKGDIPFLDADAVMSQSALLNTYRRPLKF